MNDGKMPLSQSVPVSTAADDEGEQHPDE